MSFPFEGTALPGLHRSPRWAAAGSRDEARTCRGRKQNLKATGYSQQAANIPTTGTLDFPVAAPTRRMLRRSHRRRSFVKAHTRRSLVTAHNGGLSLHDKPYVRIRARRSGRSMPRISSMGPFRPPAVTARRARSCHFVNPFTITASYVAANPPRGWHSVILFIGLLLLLCPLIYVVLGVPIPIHLFMWLLYRPWLLWLLYRFRLWLLWVGLL